MRNLKVESDYSSWWYGNIFATGSSEFTEDLYKEVFSGYTSYSMAKSLIEDYKEGAEEVMPLTEANDCVCDIIKECILNGNDYGTVELDNGYINWEFKFNEHENDSAYYKDMNFFDLSEVTQEHIVNAILDDGCKQGDLYETYEYDVEISVDEIEMKNDGNYAGTLNLKLDGPNCEGEFDIDFDYVVGEGFYRNDIRGVGGYDEPAVLYDILHQIQDDISLEIAEEIGLGDEKGR